MTRIKIFVGLVLVVAVMMAVTGTALAAPTLGTVTATATPGITPVVTANPLAPIVGSLQTITLSSDANNVTTVAVTLLDANNVTQTVTLSLDQAVTLGLVSLDANLVPSVVETQLGRTITLQPTAPTTLPVPTPEVIQNPVGAAIAAFFDLDGSVVEELHQNGMGYGLIAQACWNSYVLTGDASRCSEIAEAKKSGDFSAIELPGGGTASNWGQLKNALSEHGRSTQNLGGIISGRAESLLPTALPSPVATSQPAILAQPATGNGNNQGNGNNSNGQGNGNGNGNGNGQGDGNGNGNGNGQGDGQGNGNGDDQGNGNGNGNGNGEGNGKGPNK